MKINWGLKIALLYIGFVIFIISMVSMAIYQQVDLVSKDYYEQELQYQNKINMQNRTNALSEQLTWEVKRQSVTFTFPKEFEKEEIKGTVYFFRPSDAKMDTTISFSSPHTHRLDIATDQLKKGVYKMQVSWEVNNEKFYNEGILKFN